MAPAPQRPAHVSPEVLAQVCEFDEGELKWVPAKEPSAAVAVKLTKAVSGKRCLVVGEREVPLADVRAVAALSPKLLTLQVKGQGHMGLRCDDGPSMEAFVKELVSNKADYERFEQYDQSSVQSYFQYYAKLANQQNMLQDSVRTSLYQEAILSNPSDFTGATVMDVGAGSGILSFFSCQAGAAVVYAVEASSAAETVRTLAAANTMNLRGAEVRVVNKPLETIGEEVPEKVDCIVSEPIGTFLFNERMIETYICARDRFLKPGGKLFPNVGNLCIAPFSDAVLHGEQAGKNSFWNNTSFYGLDLTAAAPRSRREHLTQPVVDYINPECLVSEYITTRFDFMTCTLESLQNIEIPFTFAVGQPCLVHGIAGWFDAVFEGSDSVVTLSTAPWCPGTHWYQIRFLLETPLAVNAGQILEGTLKMEANSLQSYYIKIHMGIQGTGITSSAERIDLKDPEYRFFTSTNTYVPPGTQGAFGQQAQAVDGSAVGGPAAYGQAMAGQVYPQQAQQGQELRPAKAEPPAGAPPMQLLKEATSGSATRTSQQQQRPAHQGSASRCTTRSRSAKREVR